MSEQLTNREAPSADEAKWQKFVTIAFEAAKLPEVTEDQLEAGSYTNVQIAEKLRDDPLRLLSLLNGVSRMDSPVEKRSILSFAVDIVESEKDKLPK